MSGVQLKAQAAGGFCASEINLSLSEKDSYLKLEAQSVTYKKCRIMAFPQISTLNTHAIQL